MKKEYAIFFFLLVFAIIFYAFAKSSKQFSLRPGKDYALFFAVSNYKNSSLTNLPNSIPDARAIAEVLEKSYGFKTEVITDPTLDVIEQKLNEYREKFAKGTFAKDGQLFLFFSGHGVKEYNNGYFLSTDADPSRLSRTAFAYNIWRPIISEIQCQHILVAVDACYSVTFDPSWESKNDPKFQRIGELSESERILANHKDYKNRIFFTADAKENTVPGRSNFARKLLEGLLANQYKGSFITSTELFANYVQKAQPAPRANHFEGDDPNSSFLFFPTQQVKVDPQRFDQRQRDIEAYRKIQQNATVAACQQYLLDFPEGNFRSEVAALLLQLQDEQEWQFALLKNTNASYENYLHFYPDGKYAAEARAKINQLVEIKSIKDTLHNIKIQFGEKSYAIKFSDYGTLAGIARFLKSNMEAKIVITGYAGSQGTGMKNDSLAYQRAKSVKDHLLNNHGIGTQRLILQWQINSENNKDKDLVEFRIATSSDIEMQSPDFYFKDQNKSKVPSDFVFVKGGTFQMGDQFGDGDADEKPVHYVTLTDFYIGKYEVTFEEYDAFCDSAKKGKGKPKDNGWSRGKHPVIFVNWFDAIEYCNWRSRKEGLQEVYTVNSNYSRIKVIYDWTANGYRLPTEAEWEYAAQGGNKNKDSSYLYSGGNYLDEVGWYAKNSTKKTSVVGAKKPNQLNIYDMTGNVWEWCWDGYRDNYYNENSTFQDPRGPAEEYIALIRGGSWEDNPKSCRVTNRESLLPTNISNTKGFRLARRAN
ncbi:MAG: SUMF1/EgtB/PvdO family nonheme iron enzyme [Saprospiraceae bacterium]